jgi:phosphinothricin acetyltransferase
MKLAAAMTPNTPPLPVRPARADDAEAVARIYNEGIEDRVATFETRLRSVEEVLGWLGGRHPVVVVDDVAVIAFGAASLYRPRECYAGVAECSVYVAREFRGRGAGRVALAGLVEACAAAGFWKLVSRVFPENTASRALLRSLHFREVGVYEKHGRLDGVWRDVVIVERLIEANLAG